VQGNENLLEHFLNSRIFNDAAQLLNPAIRNFFWSQQQEPLSYQTLEDLY